MKSKEKQPSNTFGIVFVVFGILSVLADIYRSSQGEKASFPGLIFIVIGAYSISRVNKKRAEDAKKKDWENQSTKSEENK